MLLLANFDTQITNLINFLLPHTQVLDNFFSFFSLKGNSFFIWIFIVILILIFEERKNPGISKKDLKFVSIFIICFLVASFVSQILIKNIVKRPRPCSQYSIFITIPKPGKKKFECPTDYSFPSSHATTAFAAATVITGFDKKRRWYYFLVAALISLSRIYLGYHYFFDVISGDILGYLTSKILLAIHILDLLDKYLYNIKRFHKK